jgi:hypothetical protein
MANTLSRALASPAFFVLHAARGTWFHLLTGLAPPIIIAT